jgi:hypothetical protein
MRASFGAFPLGCALVAFASLRARRWHLSGLVTVAAVLGSALVVRLYGALADHTFQQSRTVLTAEALMFALSLAAIVSEVGAAHARPGDSPRASN